jgi:large subunit ribosomal protein L9
LKGLVDMKVLLLQDVYKLGRAGDVKKVADGYGRNYLLPQGLAVLATPGALKQVEQIRTQAAATRTALNQELSGVSEQLSDVVLTFPAKAGETGKLYGSITTQMIAEAIQDKVGVEIDRRQLDTQPLRTLGEHKVNVRLTMDLVPEVTVLVYREGESPEQYRASMAEAEAMEEVLAADVEQQPDIEVEEEIENEAETAE